MFTVFIFQIACIREELQKIADSRNREIQNVEDVINTLQSLSGMGEIIGTLKKKKAELDYQQRCLQDMVQGLEELRQRYERAECRICEKGNK